MSKLLTIDALFLNEDRHTHNIAVLMDDMGEFHYCPYFDHGAGVMSDTTVDYPINCNIEEAISDVSAKTFCTNFDEQLDVAEKLYGQQIQFSFSAQDVEDLLNKEKCYSKDVRERVRQIIVWQSRKYQYLFGG